MWRVSEGQRPLANGGQAEDSNSQSKIQPSSKLSQYKLSGYKLTGYKLYCCKLYNVNCQEVTFLDVNCLGLKGLACKLPALNYFYVKLWNVIRLGCKCKDCMDFKLAGL